MIHCDTPANEKDNNRTYVAFIGHLLASFETSTRQKGFDLDKYGAIMQQLLASIETFNPYTDPKPHDRNEMDVKSLRKEEVEWIFLDRQCHEHVTEDSSIHWIATGVTIRGVSFKLSLCKQKPPNKSQLLFKADVPNRIFTSAHDITYFHLPPLSGQFSVLVISSHEKTLLLEVSCAGTDYFVMGVVPPALIHLPPLGTEIYSGVGIMRRGDCFVVAALEQGVGKEWYIHFFSSSAGAWCRKIVHLPSELDDWPGWEISTVLVCGGSFWWLDLRRGLLSCSCNSLLEENNEAEQMTLVLKFTALPNVSMEEAKRTRFSDYNLLQDRCVMASCGHLTCVDVHVQRPHQRRAGAPHILFCDDCRGGSVTTWTLDHISSAWVKRHEVKLSTVWKDDSYSSRHLPKEAPEFPVVHRLDDDIVYFSIMEGNEPNCREFGVNLRTRSVTSCSCSHKDVSFLPVCPVFPVGSGKPCFDS